MQILAPLSEFLQAKDSDLTEAMKETKAVYTVIQNELNDDLVLYASAVEYAATIDVEPSSPRCANRQEHRANVPANSIDIYWKRSVFLPFYDHVFQELDDRLLGCSDRFLAQYFISSNLSQLSDNRITEVYEVFKDDIPVSAAVLM